jgi:RimJ/RimL family protein N-acetyltransferase
MGGSRRRALPFSESSRRAGNGFARIAVFGLALRRSSDYERFTAIATTTMTLPELPTLTGERVTLRRPRPADADARRALGNDPDIVRMYGGSSGGARAMTEDEAKRWVETLLNHDHAWVIEAGTLIGAIRLDRVDVRDKRASLAVGIDDATRLGMGLGTQAIALVLQYAFGTLKLHRISVRVVAYNTRALRAYQKCGFVIEGREREAAFVDGTWHDDVMMGILDREYNALRSSLRPAELS